jgi:hypothetical protein
MTNWYEHPQYLPNEVKYLEEAEAAYALREAWYRVYGEYPSDKSLAVLWAKSALETGRWKSIHCYNFGNIKWNLSSGNDFFTMYACGEEVSLAQAQRLVREDPERVKIVRTYTWPNGSKRASIKIKENHSWSQFRAYKTAEDGAEDYLRFVSQKKRYAKAWQKVIEGDPKGYSHELKVAGYYTANEASYTRGVVRLFDEFMKRKDELLSWKKDEHDTDPAPPPDMEEDIQDIHDTDKDIDPPIPTEEDEIPRAVEEADTEVRDSLPDPPADPRPKGKGFLTITTIVITSVGALIAWLLQSC